MHLTWLECFIANLRLSYLFKLPRLTRKVRRREVPYCGFKNNVQRPISQNIWLSSLSYEDDGLIMTNTLWWRNRKQKWRIVSDSPRMWTCRSEYSAESDCLVSPKNLLALRNRSKCCNATYINSELDDERSQFKSVSAPKPESLTTDLKVGRYRYSSAVLVCSAIRY